MDSIVVLTIVGFAVRWRTGRRRIVAAFLGSAAGGTLYHVVLETATGRTVGKRVVGIAVRDEDGGAASGRAVVARTLLRAVDWLPAGYLLGGLSILVTDDRQRVGDLVAGTVVVFDDAHAEHDPGATAGRRARPS